MRAEDLIILSIDDHLIEPPDMFDQHVPAKYADQAPKLIRDADGLEKWVFQGTTMGVMGLNSVVSWPKEQWGMDPSTLSEMRPGSYDIHERIRDMNRNGVLASMCFPTFPGFSGRTFQEAAETGDPELALDHVAGLQRLAHRRVVRAPTRAGSCRWPSPRSGTSRPWSPRSTGSPPRAAGPSAMPELPHLLGLPSYQSRPLGPVLAGRLRRGRWWCACTSARAFRR